MISKIVMGIDVGTQGTKAVLYDLESHSIIAKGSSSYGMIESNILGRAEQHPATWQKAGLSRQLTHAFACRPNPRHVIVLTAHNNNQCKFINLKIFYDGRP